MAYLLFLLFLAAIIGAVVTFCMAVVAIFQRNFKRALILLAISIGLIVISYASVTHYYGSLSRDQLTMVAVAGGFVFVFTLGFGFVIRRDRD